MSEPQDVLQSRLERRSLELFHDSVENLDMPMCSRLNRARHAALAAVAGSRPPPLFRPALWAPAGGMAVAAVLGVALWFGTPAGASFTHRGIAAADNPPGLEDLDIVASDGSGDALDMLQDDLDFYDFADGAAGTEPAA